MAYFFNTCGCFYKGRKIIVYGVLTNAEGCPVAVSVYPGDTADPLTVGDQIRKLRERFGLQRLVLVGDRGMLTQARIEELQGQPGVGWIPALRSCAIRKLLRQETIQPSLFDQRNLAEISSPEFPGERLVACFNPLLAEKRKRKREVLLTATEKELTRIQAEVRRRTRKRLAREEIALKVGRVLHRYQIPGITRGTSCDG